MNVTNTKEENNSFLAEAYAYLPAPLTQNGVITSRWKKLEKAVSGIAWHDENTICFDTAKEKILLQILYWSEQLFLSMRQLLSNRQPEKPIEMYDPRREKWRSDILKEKPVRLDVQDGLIRIFTPLTYLRDTSESWFLATMLKVAIGEYERTNGRIRNRIEKPVYIIIRRKAYAMKKGFQDNENLETTKLINILFSFLGFPDGPKNAGYVSLFQLIDRSEACGTEIMLLEQKKLADHIDLLSF